jgi:acyl-CoA synthetase (AMP-forming)/AMP-acid ligase II
VKLGNIEEQLVSLPHYLDRWARRFPEREAAVDGHLRLTYAQLAEAVDGCARAFLDAGVRPGDRVAMLTTPRLEFLIVLLALHRIGAVWVGLNPRHRLAELDHVVKDTAPRLLLGIERFEGRDYEQDLRELARRNELPAAPVIIGGEQPDPRFYETLRTRDVQDEELSQAARAVGPGSLSCIVYTSGSTGQPKGAMLSRHGQLRAYEHWLSYLGTGPIRMISDLPVDHVAGLAPSFVSLMGGGTVVFMNRFDPDELLRCIERERITVWPGELTQWVKCAPLHDQYDLSSLRLVGYGGGVPPRELLDRYLSVTPRAFSGYGMTETSDAIMFTDPDALPEVLCEHNVGKPLDGVLTRLVSPDGEPLPRESTGLLEVRSSTVFLGYLNRPEATAAAFSDDGWFRTGDVLCERDDGTFDFLGRADHTYKSGGYNIYPQEIEVVLEGHPAVRAAAVVSVSDEVFQAVGHAFVERVDNGSVDLQELRSYCSERLANYKVPKTITIIERLPMLRNEKIDRVLLGERALEMVAGASAQYG